LSIVLKGRSLSIPQQLAIALEYRFERAIALPTSQPQAIALEYRFERAIALYTSTIGDRT
jgi:hypothetical protein